MATTQKPKKQAQSQRKSVLEPITQREIEVVHMLAQDKTHAEIEKHFDLPSGYLKNILSRKSVKDYQRQYTKAFVDHMARLEARRLGKLDITRDVVLQRFMELAQLDPERTRGTIDGQVNALREVAAAIGMKLDEKKIAEMLGSMTDDQLRTMEPASSVAQ